jgi:hypothetical protein
MKLSLIGLGSSANLVMDKGMLGYQMIRIFTDNQHINRFELSFVSKKGFQFTIEFY